MTDHVRLWSDELARDPSSLVFLPLAETLRRRGQLELARKVATRGVERHPRNPEAHDQLARIQADAGDLAAAYESWRVVLRLVPAHAGALKGMAFVRFQQGELAEAERLLIEAEQQDGGAGVADDADADVGDAADEMFGTMRAALRPGPATAAGGASIAGTAEPRALFASLLEPGQSGILLDSEGLVLAGAYRTGDGRDVSEAVGATLTGVSAEAMRTTRHLDIGGWRSITFECEAAVVSLSPVGTNEAGSAGLLLVAAPPSTPIGRLHRVLDRCRARSSEWLGPGGGSR